MWGALSTVGGLLPHHCFEVPVDGAQGIIWNGESSLGPVCAKPEHGKQFAPILSKARVFFPEKFCSAP